MGLEAFKLRHLQILVAIEDQGKVGLVAEMFHVSQPSLSRTLSDLEQAAGHRLFTRHSRGILLTTEGQVLVRHARTLLSEARRAQYEMKLVAAGRRGRVSIGTVMTPASDVIVPALVDAQVEYSDLDFNIVHGSSDELLSQLSSGRLDFAVCRLSGATNASLFEYTHLGEEPLRMVVALDHPLADRKAVTKQDLEGLDWVLQPEGSYLRDVIDDYHRRNSIIPRSIISTSSVLMTILLVKQGRWVGIFAETVSEMLDQYSMLRALPIDAGIKLPGFGLVRLRDRELSPQAKGLFDVLLRRATTSVGGGMSSP